LNLIIVESSHRSSEDNHVNVMKGFKQVEHTADWAFQARGRDLQELFVNAARALHSLEYTSPKGNGDVSREVQIEGVDRESLLVNWLNELLYLEQMNVEVYDRFEIQEFHEWLVRACLHGRRQDKRQTRIKAVTFHNLEVRQGSRGWEATVVVDV
jgi:SHS2 domain-containing protein